MCKHALHTRYGTREDIEHDSQTNSNTINKTYHSQAPLAKVLSPLEVLLAGGDGLNGAAARASLSLHVNMISCTYLKWA